MIRFVLDASVARLGIVDNPVACLRSRVKSRLHAHPSVPEFRALNERTVRETAYQQPIYSGHAPIEQRTAPTIEKAAFCD